VAVRFRMSDAPSPNMFVYLDSLVLDVPISAILIPEVIPNSLVIVHVLFAVTVVSCPSFLGPPSLGAFPPDTVYTPTYVLLPLALAWSCSFDS